MSVQRMNRVLTAVLMNALLLATPLWMPVQTASQGWAEDKKEAANEQALDEIRQRARSIEAKKRALRAKKNAKLQEARKVNSNIVTNQRYLESARRKRWNQQNRLRQLRVDQQKLEADMDRTVGEQKRLNEEASRRLRTLYMGGRVNLMQMVLDAGNISAFLDRLYYKQRMVAHDKRVLEELAQKSKTLKEQRTSLSQQQVSIDQSILNLKQQELEIEERKKREVKYKQALLRDAKYYEQSEQELLRQSAKLEGEIQKLTAGSSAQKDSEKSTGSFSQPVHGRISSGFGYRHHPIFRKRRMHTGLDIAAPHGTPVKASDGGRVIQVAWRGGYGKVVVVNHGNRNGKNYTTLYAHLSSQLAKVGQTVQKGQAIGKVGSTGSATGPHLHFEIRVDGKPVNPAPYLH